MPYAPGRNGTCEKKKIKKHEVKIQSLLMSYFMVILREVFFSYLNVTAVITDSDHGLRNKSSERASLT